MFILSNLAHELQVAVALDWIGYYFNCLAPDSIAPQCLLGQLCMCWLLTFLFSMLIEIWKEWNNQIKDVEYLIWKNQGEQMCFTSETETI